MPNLALQLYTLRDQLQADLEGTVRRLAEIGYDTAEIVAATRADVVPVLREHGIRPVSAHVSLDLLATPEATVAELAEIGCEYAVLASLPAGHRQSVAAVREAAATLGAAAPVAAAQGLRIGYHNHAFEFDPLEGTTIFEVLVQETDPAVFFELDVYWLARAGVDPAARIRALAGRVPLLHVKDVADDEAHSFAPVGTGVLDWAGILGAAREAGTEWYIVEQDQSDDPLVDVATALRNLRSMVPHA